MKDNFNITVAITLSIFIIALTSGLTATTFKQKENELQYVKAGLEQCDENSMLSNKIIWVKDCVAYKNSKKD